MISRGIFQFILEQGNHKKVLVLNKIAVPFRPFYREAEKQATDRGQNHDEDAQTDHARYHIAHSGFGQ